MATLTNPDAFSPESLKDSRQGLLLGVNILMIILSTTAVVLRFIARRLVRLPLGWDDYCILLSLTACVGLFIINMIMTHLGMGKHLLATNLQDLPTFLECLYAYGMIYTVCIVSTKISILFFYHRIFKIPVFQQAAKGMIIFVLCCGISAFGVLIFPCKHIHDFWDKAMQGGQCINYEVFVKAEAIVTITTDIMTLCMPMPLVWSLKVPRRQKVMLSGIFLLGGFVCIASAIRVPTLHRIFSIDTTWEIYAASQWSIVECNLGVVCACLPLLRPFIQKSLRKTSSSVNRNFPRSTRSSAPPKSLTTWRTWTSEWTSKGASQGVTLSSMPHDGHDDEGMVTLQELSPPGEARVSRADDASSNHDSLHIREEPRQILR